MTLISPASTLIFVPLIAAVYYIISKQERNLARICIGFFKVGFFCPLLVTAYKSFFCGSTCLDAWLALLALSLCVYFSVSGFLEIVASVCKAETVLRIAENRCFAVPVSLCLVLTKGIFAASEFYMRLLCIGGTQLYCRADLYDLIRYAPLLLLSIFCAFVKTGGSDE